MKITFLTRLICSIALFIVAGSAMAQGKGADVIRVSLAGQTVFNPCTLENIVFAGEAQVVVRIENSANGGFHVLLSVSAHTLAAVGMTTGQHYKIVGPDGSQHINTSVSGAQVFSIASRFAFISQSGDENLFVTMVNRITVNANGVLTVDKTDMLFECR